MKDDEDYFTMHCGSCMLANTVFHLLTGFLNPLYGSSPSIYLLLANVNKTGSYENHRFQDFYFLESAIFKSVNCV